jgi:GT2 family glycosyltransferase/glycosyltransferase involved in cell wall biosynthesis
LPALIVSYSAGPGGAERILADHASALGDDTCVACPDGWLADAIREQGLRVFPLKERPLELRGQSVRAALRLAGHAREVRELVTNLRPRVVVAWNMRSLLACSRIDAPLVFQHNDLLPSPAVAHAVRAAASRADKVIALSQAIADDLGVPGTQVIHPGVDLERFAPTPPGEGALFLGVDKPWKRLGLAREACRIAGVPLTVPSGFEDPVPLLRDAACLIHAADREPFGLALVEALACDVPVVAPAAGGPPEIVDDTSGRLYPPGDTHAAADAIREVLGADLNPRARAEAHFDLRESRRRWAEAIGAGPAPQRGDGIALVTVLHDSEREVRALMASIERHLPGARLIAADSGSRDGGADAVRAWGGTVIDMGGNVGFGRATNAGVAAADEPVVAVVNPDVELLDSSLAELARQAAEGERILAPLVVQPDGRRELSAHAEPPQPGLLVKTPAPRRRQVAWAAGCCLVARTDVLRKLGPFDERVFLYGEDIDLGLRAKDAGVETWFEPSARVLHVRAHSTEREFGGEAFELLARRRAEVVEERRGRTLRRVDSLTQAFIFVTRIAGKAVLRRSNERPRAQLRALLRVTFSSRARSNTRR